MAVESDAKLFAMCLFASLVTLGIVVYAPEKYHHDRLLVVAVLVFSVLMLVDGFVQTVRKRS